MRRLRVRHEGRLERHVRERDGVQQHTYRVASADRIARLVDVPLELIGVVPLDKTHALLVQLFDELVQLVARLTARRLVLEPLAPVAKVGRYDEERALILQRDRSVHSTHSTYSTHNTQSHCKR